MAPAAPAHEFSLSGPEAFTQDLIWHQSSLLISAERGDLENEFAEITPDEAARIADRIRQSVPGEPGSPTHQPANRPRVKRQAGFVLYAGEESLSFGERLKALPIAALWELTG